MGNLNDAPCTMLTQPLPKLTTVTTQVRTLNEDLWELLTKAEPLTAAEWAYVEDLERQTLQRAAVAKLPPQGVISYSKARRWH
jgi:hypothetical protein